MKSISKSLIVMLISFFSSAMIFTSCSFSVDVVSKCKSQADQSYESILNLVKKEMSAEWESQYENIAKNIFEDPNRRRLDFSSCLTDEGALCYVQSEELIDIKPLLIERGWANPTPWDCYWPKSKMTTANPFA